MPKANTAAETARKRRATIDPNEDKAGKFKRLINARMGQARKSLTGIANLSGNSYDYTPQQVQRITNDLQTWVDNVKTAFANRGPGKAANAYSI